MTTRIYVVKDAAGNEPLIEASSAAQAIRHVVANAYDARVASTKDVARLMGDGAEVQMAKGEGA